MGCRAAQDVADGPGETAVHADFVFIDEREAQGMRAEVLREIVCTEGSQGRRAHLVLFANRRWLPLETAYPLQIREERDRGIRQGQVAMLESNGGPGTILRLFHAAWERFQDLKLDAVYVAVDPDDAAFYERFLFEGTGWGPAAWDFADYATVEVLRLDVLSVVSRARGTVRRRFIEEARA